MNNVDKFLNKMTTLYSKEYLTDLYITQNKSKYELCNILDVCLSSLNKILAYYNITKDKNRSQGEKLKQTNQEKFNTLLNEITKDSILKYYIEENHTYNECLEYFKVTGWTFDKILKHYEVNKDRSISAKVGLNTKYQKAGSKKDYYSQIANVRKSNIIDKYGSETAYYDQIQQKMKNTSLKKYGVTHIAQLRDVAIKKSITRASVCNDEGEYFDSTWKLLIYEYCKRNDIPIKRNIRVPFIYNGKEHSTIIDFEINGFLVEVKGSHLLHGCFDHNQIIPIEQKLKVYKENNVLLITDSNSKDIFRDSCGWKYGKSLIGIDVSLFDDPVFPYDPTKPKCFYDVKVSSKYSAKEAFDNELIRWEMIKNRILYKGGFITNSDILRALNVTRKAKQPSWFKKELAVDLIKKYASTDVIVDTFAGWGMRYEAAKDLNKQYIGIDLNPELVEYHKSLGRTIDLGDAKMFKYDDECSVLICPPYHDIEIYIDNQDIELTQCQWLEIVMKNVPNAAEYIMVCKKVDPGYEQYIVDTISNKSHLGINREYVLLIKNNKKI